MVTNAETAEGPPTKEEKAEGIARSVIAGHPQGAVRRIILYVIVGASMVVGIEWQAAVVGIIALMLLLATDSLL